VKPQKPVNSKRFSSVETLGLFSITNIEPPFTSINAFELPSRQFIVEFLETSCLSQDFEAELKQAVNLESSFPLN
jgi:hypothetical protein